MSEAVMARLKGRPKRQGKVEARTVVVRCTVEWAGWLEAVAKFDRSPVATILGRAVADRAQAIGSPEPPPERLP